tara:strand:- start:10012 stop:10488 length:477 start_codon:yes stop_codon:yes gene_type:complete
MILCLVGTSPYCFRRLIEVVDKEIGVNYEVMVQKGYSNYSFVNSKSFDFIEGSKLKLLISKADLIITQGGYGSLMDSILENKKIIAIPRLEEYNEIVGDQIELINYFEKKEYVIGCYNLKHLKNMVDKCLSNEVSFKKFKPESKKLISRIISNYVKSF